MDDADMLTLVAGAIASAYLKEIQLLGIKNPALNNPVELILASIKSRNTNCYGAIMREASIVLSALEKAGLLKNDGQMIGGGSRVQMIGQNSLGTNDDLLQIAQALLHQWTIDEKFSVDHHDREEVKKCPDWAQITQYTRRHPIESLQIPIMSGLPATLFQSCQGYLDVDEQAPMSASMGKSSR